jgi:hypothetical protein
VRLSSIIFSTSNAAKALIGLPSVFTLAVLGAASATPPAPPCSPPGATIDTVVIDAAGLADGPRASDLVTRLAGALHVATRASVIRRAVLLRAGDCYDSLRLAASERALWALQVFRSVQLDTVRLPGERLAFRVSTADGWSARPVADYARTGGRTSWEAGILEQNLLGTATRLFASYRSTPDRSTAVLQYLHPNLILPGGRLDLWHRSHSNGRHSAWSIGLPFREPASRAALVADGEWLDEHVLRYGEDATTQSGARSRVQRVRLEVAWAPRASPAGYLRLWTGVRWRDQGWSPAPGEPIGRASFVTAGGGVEVSHQRFRRTKNLNGYTREEWVDVSNTLRLGIWAAPGAWGYGSRRGVGAEVRWQGAHTWRDGHAAVRGHATGAWTQGKLDSGQVRAQVTLAAQPGARHAVLVHIDAARMLGARPPGEIDLWLERRGPRLFPPHAFAGSRLWWFALEYRVLVAGALGRMIGIGLATFVEYAAAANLAGQTKRAGDAGLALRLAPLRLAAGDVTELALGRRIGPGQSGAGWVLALRKGFTF